MINPLLTIVLSDRHRMVRVSAVKNLSFAFTNTGDIEVATLLAKSLGDSDRSVKDSALEGISRVLKGAGEKAEELENLVTNHIDPFVRDRAPLLQASIHSDMRPEELVEILQPAISSQNTFARKMAVRGLGMALEKYGDSLMVDVLEPLLKDPCVLVRREILQSLGGILFATNLKPILSKFREEKNRETFKDLSEWMIAATGNIFYSSGNPQAVEFLEKEFSHPGWHRRDVAYALSQIMTGRGVPGAEAIIEYMVDLPPHHGFARVAAQWSLPNAFRYCKELEIQDAIKYIESCPHSIEVRGSLLIGLGLLVQGSGNNETVGFLKTFVENKDKSLRKKALIALALTCQGTGRIEVLPGPYSDTLNEYPLALALIEQGKADPAISHKMLSMMDQMAGKRGRKNLILSLGIAFQGQGAEGVEILQTYLEGIFKKGAVSERMAVTRALALTLTRHHQLGEFQRAYGRGAGAAAFEHIVFSSLVGKKKSSALPHVFYD